MEKTKVLVKILYCTEDNDLVLHCPQLAVYGVCEGILKDNLLNDKLVLDSFETKLRKQIKRLPSEAEFLRNLLEHGHWITMSDRYRPRPVQYFINLQPVLKRMIDLPDSKMVNYSFEYRQPSLKQ